MELHAKYMEYKILNQQIDDLDKKIKILKKTKKEKSEQIFAIMEKNNLDEYLDLKKTQIQPKEKKKPRTQKDKKLALIQFFKKMGINDPENFVKEIKNIEKNSL